MKIALYSLCYSYCVYYENSQSSSAIKCLFLFQLKSAWAGYYDYNIWDQNLIIGPHPVITNFLLANGMSGHGLQQSVCVGNAISEILLQGETSAVDLSRFTFDRIIRREKILEDFIV